MDIPLVTLPPLPHISLSLILNVPILLCVLGAFGLFYCVVSSVLFYHWHAYGMGSQGILVGESLFLLVSVFLFVSAGLCIFYF